MMGSDNDQVRVTKVSYNGVPGWSNDYGGPDQESCNDGCATIDGGLIAAGSTNSYGAGDRDFWLVKLDSSGNQEWTASYGTPEKEWAHSVEQTSDGGFIVFGNRNIWHPSSDTYDAYAYLVKTDSEGNLEWDMLFDGVFENEGESVSETSDLCYILTGNAVQADSDLDLWLVKLDSSGNLMWEKIFQDPYTIQSGECVIQTSDGGYVITGSASYSEILVLKTDSLGNELWSREYAGTHSFSNYGACIVEAFEGGYTLTGSIHGDSGINCFVRKLDQDGNTEWYTLIDGSPYNEYGRSIVQLSDGGYAVGGYLLVDSIYEGDAFIARLSPPEGISSDYHCDAPEVRILSITPLPFSNSVDIVLSTENSVSAEVSVFDLSGRSTAVIHTGVLQSGDTSLYWNGTDTSGRRVSSGTYLLRVCSQNGTQYSKLLFLP
jgi:hypothetical protein